MRIGYRTAQTGKAKFSVDYTPFVLLQAVTKAATMILDRIGTEETCTKFFSVNVSFGTTKVEFDPGRADFCSMLYDLWEGKTISHQDLCYPLYASCIVRPTES